MPDMTEPDVVLTDYGLAIECAIFAWLIATRQPRGRIRTWALVFFLSVGLGAIAGGTVHGFFLDPASTGQRALWPTALIALGVTALSMWMIAARLGCSPPVGRAIGWAAWLVFVAYTLIVCLGSQLFMVAVINYLLAGVFLIAVLWRIWRAHGSAARDGIAGLLLTFVGSIVQQSRVGIDPRYFNHNAVYHVIEAVALYLMFRMLRGVDKLSPQ